MALLEMPLPGDAGEEIDGHQEKYVDGHAARPALHNVGGQVLTVEREPDHHGHKDAEQTPRCAGGHPFNPLRLLEDQHDAAADIPEIK